MPITVRDLKDQTGMHGPHPFLRCAYCGNRCSANAGDYFAASPDYTFICCGTPMTRVVERITYRKV